jgi:hypothetical protein
VLLRVTIALESVARESPKLLPRAIAHFVNFIEGRTKNEERRRKKEERRGKKEEGRRKKQE